MRPRPARLPLAAAAVAALLAQAAPAFAQGEVHDPFERMNRGFFAIEESLDKHIFGPIAHGFGKAPSPIRRVLRNFAHNLGEPVIAVNDLLQGHPGKAASTVGRFAINSLFGVAGTMDVATRGGVLHHDNDFGITLGRWGVQPGPYLFLPLVGPMTIRDGLGKLADVGLNPLHYANYNGKVYVGVAVTVIDGLDDRLSAQGDLAVIRETSTDPYATLRSYYLQNRQSEITGQSDIGPLPELDDPAAAPSSTAPSTPASAAEPAPPAADPVPSPQSAAEACAPPALAEDAPIATARFGA